MKNHSDRCHGLSARKYSPAAERNAEAILAVLRETLPSGGLILEIASGSGQHAAYFSAALEDCTWQPTDADPLALGSIASYASLARKGTILAPKVLDVCSQPWPIAQADAIFCANMIHIAPWQACEGLMAGAGALLPQGAPMVLYGPYLEQNVETVPSNTAFDASLRVRNPEWGLRQLDDVRACARDAGFSLERRVEMPANNLSLVFVRT